MDSLESPINDTARKYIEKIAEICKEKKPLVVIRCITYNQELYIREALEGFVMQKTDFPFVAIVHEDASTDGTAEVLRDYAEKYPDIILPIFEKDNQYSKRDGSLRKIMDKACEVSRAKYIALCEGDDYWIDPFKLQKQIDFLKGNPAFGMCYTKVKGFDQEKNTFTGITGGLNETFEQFLMANNVPTLTVVYHYDIYTKYLKDIQPQSKKWLMGDYPLWLFFSHESKIKFIDEVTGIYRILPNSASHFDKTHYQQKLNFLKSGFDVSVFYINKYPLESQRVKSKKVYNYVLKLLILRTIHHKELKCEVDKIIQTVPYMNNIMKKIFLLANKNPLCNKLLFLFNKLIYSNFSKNIKAKIQIIIFKR